MPECPEIGRAGPEDEIKVQVVGGRTQAVPVVGVAAGDLPPATARIVALSRMHLVFAPASTTIKSGTARSPIAHCRCQSVS